MVRPIIYIFFFYNKEKLGKRLSKLEELSYQLYEYYVIYLLLIFSFYDLYFNNLIFTKIFYLLPFVFIFYLIVNYHKFLDQISVVEKDLAICCYYYSSIVLIEEKNFTSFKKLTFKNNVIFYEDDIMDAILFFRNNCQINIENEDDLYDSGGFIPSEINRK
jgi:predicted CDP-diglyceride synthetase/phosphatidate cytidylyltransferase